MNEALAILIWTVAVVVGVTFITFFALVIIGLVIGLNDFAKDKRKKRKEGNA